MAPAGTRQPLFRYRTPDIEILADGTAVCAWQHQPETAGNLVDSVFGNLFQ